MPVSPTLHWQLTHCILNTYPCSSYLPTQSYSLVPPKARGRVLSLSTCFSFSVIQEQPNVIGDGSKWVVDGDDRSLGLVEHFSLFWLCLEVMWAEAVPSEHSESQIHRES